jgi:S1-C subfamily serine protease
LWLLASLCGGAAAASRPAAKPAKPAPAASHQAALLSAGGGDLQRQIYLARDRVLPALVNVQPVVRDFSSGTKEKQRVTGSGVLIRDDGYVVTNYHVAGRPKKSSARCGTRSAFAPGSWAAIRSPISRSCSSTIPSTKRERPRPATFGDSHPLQTGQLVMALGSPFALSRLAVLRRRQHDRSLLAGGLPVAVG